MHTDRPSFPARRCLIVVPDLGRGGAERQAALVGQALGAEGYNVRLFVQAPPYLLARDGVTGDLELDLPASPGSVLAQLGRLRRAVEAFAPDVVITFLRGAEGRFALTRTVSAAARRAAWIATARGNVRLLHLAQAPVTFGAQLFWLRLADRICPNSAALGGNLLAMDDRLAAKIVVIPNIMQPFAVNAEAARERVDGLVGGLSHRPVIGCIGSFQDERNYLLLASALPLVLRAHPSAHCLLVGKTTGDQVSSVAAEFHARIHALGLQEHVTVAGEIPEARTLLAGLDVFALCPSSRGRPMPWPKPWWRGCGDCDHTRIGGR